MRLFPQSYNGFLFQQNGKVASDFANPYDWNIQGITTSDIPRSGNFPLRVAKNYTGSIKVITVNLLDVDATRDSLVIAGDILGEDQGQLIALDEFGRSWYVDADFIGLTEDSNSEKKASFGAAFAVDDPIWKLLTPSTQTIEVNGTGTGTLAPIGNQPALPVITITPLAAGINDFGFTHQRFITIINNSPNALVDYPIDVTNGGLDTAALVTAGKMLANGDDCRIYVDGVDVKRWFGGGGINNASTSIWINFNQPANSNMTLGTAIAGAGDITVIQIENLAANVAAIQNIPLKGNVLIDSEIFVYTGVDKGALQLTGVTRAERQTSAGAHSSGDIIYFVTHDVWLYYGNPNIESYVVDDTYKPIINLTTSTNGSHVYDEFYTVDGKRTAQWKKGTILPALGAVHYTATENTIADPATVAGMWCLGASLLTWTIYNPCGFTEITTLTGKKYADIAVFNAFMVWSMFGITYNSLFDESDPTPAGGWEALATHTNIPTPPISVDPYYKAYYLQLWCYGPGGASASAMEIGATTLEIDSAKVPTISLAAESTNFNLHSVITNAATGFSITIDVSLQFFTYITVDTKNKRVTLYDGSNQINAIQDFPIRAQWFPLLPMRDNAISITDEGNVQYVFTWEDRSL